MSLSSHGMFFIGLVLGSLVVLAIFSMLAMARRQDDDQDRLEIELRRRRHPAFQSDLEGSPENISTSVNLESAAKPQIFSNR